MGVDYMYMYALTGSKLVSLLGHEARQDCHIKTRRFGAARGLCSAQPHLNRRGSPRRKLIQRISRIGTGCML
jgi:hypothetical protein